MAVVDYGVGNRFSIVAGLRRAGAIVELTRDARRLEEADGIVLPGVGSFPAAMRVMEEAGIVKTVRGHVEAGKPLLGVCLGLQLLFEWSEEWGGSRGLGLLPGVVKRMPVWRKPHMAWTRVWRIRPSRLLRGVSFGEYFYFAHSYYAVPRDDSIVVARAVHSGHVFPAVVERHPVYATQFHPEKSGAAGLRVLRNWVVLVAEAARR